nr:uncharacterized protein LOC127334808 isoform X2 [Lolium perenne]
MELIVFWYVCGIFHPLFLKGKCAPDTRLQIRIDAATRSCVLAYLDAIVLSYSCLSSVGFLMSISNLLQSSPGFRQSLQRSSAASLQQPVFMKLHTASAACSII